MFLLPWIQQHPFTLIFYNLLNPLHYEDLDKNGIFNISFHDQESIVLLSFYASYIYVLWMRIYWNNKYGLYMRTSPLLPVLIRRTPPNHWIGPKLPTAVDFLDSLLQQHFQELTPAVHQCHQILLPQDSYVVSSSYFGVTSVLSLHFDGHCMWCLNYLHLWHLRLLTYLIYLLRLLQKNLSAWCLSCHGYLWLHIPDEIHWWDMNTVLVKYVM